MSIAVIGIGALLCGGGAWAHFRDSARHREGMFALAGFCFLLCGLFLTRG